MSEKTFTAVRVTFPDSLNSSELVRVLGRLSRWACINMGHVMSTPDSTFFFCDLPGDMVQQLCRIVEVGGGVSRVRLVSSSFFDRLFDGDLKGVA